MKPTPPFVSCQFPGLKPRWDVPMVDIPDPSCGYFPERESLVRAFAVTEMPGEIYHDFMDAGFRRSGQVFYQPICRGCRACVQMRVPVDRFQPSKSQRRNWRKNGDLRVTVGKPVATDEKYDLYRRYLEHRHGSGRMERTRSSFEEFLCVSPVDTLEFAYRDAAGKLVAIGICDICPRSLSTVYFFFDPDESRRGPGVYGAQYEIEYARHHGIPWYYLGFWVAGCQAMDYKADYRPNQRLDPDGVWRESSSSQTANP